MTEKFGRGPDRVASNDRQEQISREEKIVTTNVAPKQRLYSVSTTARDFKGYKDVVFDWFRDGAPAERRNYATLIEDYDPTDSMACYAEGCIDELFTEDEALKLKEYLDRVNGKEGPTTIEEVRLPIPNNTMGTGAIPVGGGQDFLEIYRRREYSLPFKVAGYFDLRGCERLDEPDATITAFPW
jgi:hypothetical protein